MIRKLPDSVVKHIAAGQIASSPRAVLKELVENSLDAGATRIRLLIGSPFSFKVVDDGVGIRYRELPLAVEKFSTSKIESLEDLKRLRSYGFRGEALHAISLLSSLTIKSRHREERLGGLIRVKGGGVTDYRPIPFSGGTAVEVEELFFNAPVRRKATGRREKSQMVKLAKLYALCHPEVEFQVDGELFYRSSLSERIHRVTGLRFELREGKGVKLFVSREKRGIRQVFLNRRPVSLPEVEKLLDEGRYPSFLLFLEVEPELVDFNLTPLKDRVLLRDDSAVRKVKELLKESLPLPSILAVRENRSLEYSRPISLIGSDGTVLIGYDHENYYFFDQHLVHERVNYERLLKLLREGKVKKKELFPPVELPLELEEKVKELSADYYREGERLVVYRVPEIINYEDLEKLGRESVESVASVACRRAVKKGYFPVKMEEVKELFNEYLKCKEKELCPHGRPIYYTLPRKKVLKHLKRI